MKKISLQLSLILILTIIGSFFTALTLKAGIGTYACWDALSVTVSYLTGLKVAHFGMIMNSLCILIQVILLKKDFNKFLLLQIPFVLLMGSMINFFYYHMQFFELHNYVVRFIVCMISIVGVAFSLGFLTSLNLVTMSVENTCDIISSKFAIDYAVLRVGIDVVCIIASVLLSVLFEIPFVIREGTFIAMVLLGTLEKVFMKKLRPTIGKIRSVIES